MGKGAFLMGIMQSEDLAALAKQLRAAEKQIQTLERDRDRLADLLRAEKAEHQRTGKRADAAEENVRQQRIQLDRFKAIAQTVDQANDAKAKADHERDTANSAYRMVKEKYDALAELNEATEDARASLAQRVQRLDEEIGPFRSLIAALKAHQQAQDTIVAELGKLDG